MTHDDQRAEEAALEDARERLGAYREGVLHFDEHFVPTPFVTDPETGRVVMPVPEAVFFAPEAILFVPEEKADALQLMLSPEREGEDSALTDRWRTYHGEPEMVRWAACFIDAGKREPFVFDGDALMWRDALAGEEPWLVRTLNENREALARAVSDRLNRTASGALAVGVDERGAHVRAKFGIVRLPFAQRATTGDAAHDEIMRLLGEGAS
jgi:hypothetical protein